MLRTTLLGQTDATIYARCANIWVMVVVAPPKLVDMQAAEGALALMKSGSPTGFPTLTWVTAAAGFAMEKDARDTAGSVTKGFNDVIRGQATLIEAGGFQGAAVRMIIAGMDRLSGTKAPSKVFATLEDAVPWCLANHGGDASAEDVLEAVRLLRPLR